jgi:transcription initiation factor TFIIIB Brf1 subunit/transcription initiation factor TFIIB
MFHTNMTYDNIQCKDCRRFGGLIESYRDGCVVCRYCGLVASDFLIDDRPLIDHRRDLHSDTFMYTNGGDCEIEDALDRLRIDSKIIELIAKSIVDEFKTNKDYKGRTAALKAHATYEACRQCNRSIPFEQVCASFQVDPKLVRQITKKGDESHVVKSQINQRIVKLASEIIQDPRTRMKAIRHACEVENKLLSNKNYVSKKPSKMDAVILFYVCTNVVGIKLKKGEFVKECGVSSVTFNRHLQFVAETLK